MVKEAAWTLSNITAGPAEQIQAVIESGLIEGRGLFLKFFINSTDLGSIIGDFDCEYSTVWKFRNFPAFLVLCEINFGGFLKS